MSSPSFLRRLAVLPLLAALATFVQLEEPTVAGLLALQEQRAIEAAELATFATLRRLVGALCGLTFLGLVPDLTELPSPGPTLPEFYAELRAGRIALADARGRGSFGLALLRTAVPG